MSEVRKEIKITGFDSKGEPVIRIMADGSLQILFAFMPPSWAPEEEGLGAFADFDKQLRQVARVKVVWDDREVFVIPSPQRDTAEYVRRFLVDYRSKR